MKILLFSAGDSRSKWLESSLEKCGHDVVFCEPEKSTDSNSDLVWSVDNQEQLVKRIRPEAVIFCPAIELFNINSLNNSLLIFDLVNSKNLDQRIIDNPNLPNYLVSALAKADSLLVDSQANRLYWYGWMLQAGKVPESEHLAFIVETNGELSEFLSFLEQPKVNSKSEPVKGYVYTRPSFLAPIGTAQDFPFSEKMGTISQGFIVPIDDLYSVVLPIRLASPESRAQIGQLRIKIQDSNAKIVVEQIIKASDLPESGSLFLNFSKLSPPKGGSKFSIKINLEETAEKITQAPLLLKVYKESNYPLSEMSCDTNKCSGSLALSFHPNSCKVFLITRALRMLSRGEWRRFVRAIRRRLAFA